MCIICRMREAGASEEVLKIGEELMKYAVDSFEIHQALNKRVPDIHTKEEDEALQEIFTGLRRGNGRENIAKALQELLGVRVEVLHAIEIPEGIENALNDALATGVGVYKIELPKSNGTIDDLVSIGKGKLH